VAAVWHCREGISGRALGERSALKNSRMSKSANLGNQHARECARKLRAGRPSDGFQATQPIGGQLLALSTWEAPLSEPGPLIEPNQEASRAL